MGNQLATGFWKPYPETKPERFGRYLTYNDWGFVSIELWTGSRWLQSYNPKEIHITHYAGIVTPDGKELDK